MYGLRPNTVFLLLVAGACPVSAQITADDFLPVVQGGPSEIRHPEEVVVCDEAVAAATTQDAINAAVEQNERDLAAEDAPEVGARMIRSPSGLGFVASGIAHYRAMENPVATRIAQRQAYVMAFTKAKKALAEILGGLSNEGRETIRQSLVNINLPEEEMTNISVQSEESLKQVVDMMLRGFVIYEVRDDREANTVYVSIVTTPGTRGTLARPAPNVLEVDDLREGLNQVIAEVRTGLVPPVGGRIIQMRPTGETAFVGFGSSIVRTSKNAAVQARLNLESQKIAAMRSKDALCGLIIGDRASWEGSVRESLQDEIREFESATADDPLAAQQPEEARKLDLARQQFVARIESAGLYRSARQGVLPPGVNTRTWFDQDHAWAYGMSVYVPSVTDAAARAAREMRDSRIVRPIDDGTERVAPPDPGAGFTDEDLEVRRPGDTVKPGPSGRIDPE